MNNQEREPLAIVGGRVGTLTFSPKHGREWRAWVKQPKREIIERMTREGTPVFATPESVRVF